MKKSRVRDRIWSGRDLDLVVTLIFGHLTSKSNQFIFVPKCN